MNEAALARILLEDKDALDFASYGEIYKMEVKKIPIERQSFTGITIVEEHTRALVQIICDVPNFKRLEGIKKVLVIGID
jgi:hypothetical protein